MTVLAARPAPAARSRRPAALVLEPVAVFLAATAVALIGIGTPALWQDEAATIAAAQRPLPALLAMAGRVDAVHTLYYALVHAWFGVAGISPTSLRAPSAVLAGATAAGLVLLGRRLAGRRAGLAAGVVAVVLPSLVWAGGEGRSSALVAAAAVFAMLALTVALDAERNGAPAVRAWLAASALLALTGAVSVVALLLVPAAVLSAVLLGPRRARVRAVLAGAAAVLAVSPLLVLALQQSGQIDWIPRYAPPSPVRQVEVEQWFRSEAVAQAAVALLVLGGAVATVRRLPGRRRVLAVALPWAVLPTAALLAAGLVHTPLYWPRYVLFTAPAVALLLGAAAAALPRALPLVALVLFTVLAAPQLAADRSRTAKDDGALLAAAELLARERSPDDGAAGLLVGRYRDVPYETMGIARTAYPRPFRGLADLTAAGSIGSAPSLFEPRTTLAAGVERAAGLRTVWVLLDPAADPADDVPEDRLRALGFTRSGRWSATGVILERWTR